MIDYLLITSTSIMCLSFLLTLGSIVYFIAFDIFTDDSNRFVLGFAGLGALFMLISVILIVFKQANA